MYNYTYIYIYIARERYTHYVYITILHVPYRSPQGIRSSFPFTAVRPHRLNHTKREHWRI